MNSLYGQLNLNIDLDIEDQEETNAHSTDKLY